MEYKELNNFIHQNKYKNKVIHLKDELTSFPELYKEIQLILIELDLLQTATGEFDIKTQRAFAEFKKLNYQSDLDYFGVNSAKLLLSCVDESQENIDNDDFIAIPRVKREYNHSKINWNDFNCPISQYFLVTDVIKKDIKRIPNNITVQKRVLDLALNLDKIQNSLDTGSIIVKSWLRPHLVNKAMGGNENSPHIYGGAVDITCHGKDIKDFQKFVDSKWYGGLGFSKGGPVHIDMRNGKGWATSENYLGEKGTRWTHSI